jgi:hypothetical protein
VRNAALDKRERLRWELLLVVGGPITAMVYLHRKLSERTSVAEHQGVGLKKNSQV